MAVAGTKMINKTFADALRGGQHSGQGAESNLGTVATVSEK